MAHIEKDEYRNNTQHWVGAIVINRKGEDVPTAVEPGGVIALSEEERELTARSHRKPGASPFELHDIQIIDPNTFDLKKTIRKPQLEQIVKRKPVETDVEAELGTADDREEVGVPDAPRARKKKIANK